MIRVTPARRQMAFGAIQISIEKRTKTRFDARLQQISGLQPALGKWLARNVTSPEPKIRWQIPQDIDQLQSFAKSDALTQQLRIIYRCVGKEMDAAHSRPEFADASGNAVGVVVQFFVRAQ